MTNCELISRITTKQAAASALVCISLICINLACPALADQPMYVGDFDGPSENKSDRSPGLIRGDLFKPLEDPSKAVSPKADSPDVIPVQSGLQPLQTPGKPLPSSYKRAPSLNRKRLLYSGGFDAKPESMAKKSRMAKQWAAFKALDAKAKAAGTPAVPPCDFPVPKLNFPREIGPPSSFPSTSNPTTVSPSEK